MLKKIYFGNKPLFLTSGNTGEIKHYQDDKGTIILHNPGKAEIDTLIKQMNEAAVTAGIIYNDEKTLFSELKKKFTLIPASGGMVHTQENKILLIFRRGKWDLPKGKLDDGEDLVACALREVEEETGLSRLAYEQALTISYHTYYEGSEHMLKESHWHLLLGDEKEELIPQTDEDIEKCEWVSIDRLPPYLENAPASIIDVIKEGINLLEKKQ